MVATRHNERLRRGCALFVGAALLALAFGCGATAFGVERGAVAPPWFDSNLGQLRLVGYSTWNAACPPFTGCVPTRQQAYVVWLVEQGSARRIVHLPIGD